ncbi:hypothetical protein EVA_03017 [gut metagenome]|uniref:Uncharacterized protein n=1 Tax=gut metagenome TaxID=749906 RepID=J9GLS4_9ZZZZ
MHCAPQSSYLLDRTHQTSHTDKSALPVLIRVTKHDQQKPNRC